MKSKPGPPNHTLTVASTALPQVVGGFIPSGPDAIAARAAATRAWERPALIVPEGERGEMMRAWEKRIFPKWHPAEKVDPTPGRQAAIEIMNSIPTFSFRGMGGAVGSKQTRSNDLQHSYLAWNTACEHVLQIRTVNKHVCARGVRAWWLWLWLIFIRCCYPDLYQSGALSDLTMSSSEKYSCILYFFFTASSSEKYSCSSSEK